MTKDIAYTNQAKRDAKKHYLFLMTPELGEVLHTLSQCKTLPEKYKDHALIGDWKGFRECHIKPDFLMIYELLDDIVLIARLGSHSELF